jgi:hypothetical protein
LALQLGGDGEQFFADALALNRHGYVVTRLHCITGGHLIRSSTKGGGNASRLSGVVVPTWPVVEDGIQHRLSSG